MPSLIYVGGIPGVGKSTVSRGLVEQLPFSIYVHPGESKRKESARRFNKKLSLLNQEESYKINSWFFCNFLNNNNFGGTVIIDSHYTCPFNGDFIRLCPPNFTSKLDLLVLLQCNADEIIRRRILRQKNGDSTDLGYVKMELAEELREAKSLSSEYALPLAIVSVSQSPETAIRDILNFLK